MDHPYFIVDDNPQQMSNIEFAQLMHAVLTRGAPFRFQANGFSMTPFIHDGDVITLEPSPARLCLGDVAAFIHPELRRLTVHRVVHISPSGYQMKGDHAAQFDGTVPCENILGRVTRVERHKHGHRLGLGWERWLIAHLSRRGWLTPTIALLAPVLLPLVKRGMP